MTGYDCQCFYFIISVHDCRAEAAQSFSDKQRWEAMLFTHGVNNTYDGIEALHMKDKEEEDGEEKK